MQPEKVLRIPAAAGAIGASKSTVWRFLREGRLTRIKISERITGVLESEIQALIANGAKQ